MTAKQIELHPENLTFGEKYLVTYAGTLGTSTFKNDGIFQGLYVRCDDNGSKVRRLVVVFEMLHDQGYASIKRAIPWYRILRLQLYV